MTQAQRPPNTGSWYAASRGAFSQGKEVFAKEAASLFPLGIIAGTRGRIVEVHLPALPTGKITYDVDFGGKIITGVPAGDISSERIPIRPPHDFNRCL